MKKKGEAVLTPDEQESRKSLDDFQDELEAEDVRPDIDPCALRCFFIFVLFTNILVNIDHGCLPAITLSIKDDFNIDNA